MFIATDLVVFEQPRAQSSVQCAPLEAASPHMCRATHPVETGYYPDKWANCPEAPLTGSVLSCKVEEEFSWLMPLKYGTGSGSDRMPGFNVRLRILLVD